MKSGILLYILSLAVFIKIGYCVDFAFYCKCFCPPNSTIVKVKDCSVCNKNLCIEQKLCVFQNSTTTTNSTTNSQRPRSIEQKSIIIEEKREYVETSFVSYSEYLYSLIFGKVKRNLMINDDLDIEINKEKRKTKSKVDKSTNKSTNKTEPLVDDNKKSNNKTDLINDDNNEHDSGKVEEEENVISIIETGTEDGYQKSEEENWMTECFKRGSLKDEAIIVLFIGSTGILLVYAIMKKCFANEDAIKYNYATLNNNAN
eukprot:jgi/Orpsp1_1/1192103/evm.model.d7180000090601.1